MADDTHNLTFGPVPSRRLGRSLGINNIPPKVCSYSCVYCQLGSTPEFAMDRREFYQTEQIVEAVKARVAGGEPIDYLTFVPDGEPTLDANLGATIDALKPLGIPLAIISNASLLWREEVRDDLHKLDFVSLKVDAADDATWRKVNRPHAKLDFETLREGVQTFAREFGGTLVTETMLIRGANDGDDHLDAVATQIGSLKPEVAYIGVPIRPPAEDWAEAPGEETLLRAIETFRRHVDTVEYLIGYEGSAFAATGDAAADLLSITAVHPMRDDAVNELLRKNDADERVLRTLVESGKLHELEYKGRRFYLRSYAGQVRPGGSAKTCD